MTYVCSGNILTLEKGKRVPILLRKTLPNDQVCYISER